MQLESTFVFVKAITREVYEQRLFCLVSGKRKKVHRHQSNIKLFTHSEMIRGADMSVRVMSRNQRAAFQKSNLVSGNVMEHIKH